MESLPELPKNAKRTPRRPKRERRFIRRTAILSVLLAAVLCAGLLVLNGLRPALTGRRIEQALEKGDFPAALSLIETLDDGPAAEEYANRCAFAMAEQLFSEGEYREAADRFAALGTYADAQERVLACAYRMAEASFAAGDYAAAADAFAQLGAFSDAQARVSECRYAEAGALEAQGALSEAAERFLSLGAYSDAHARAGAIAVRLTGEADPEAALAALNALTPEQQQALLRLNTLRKSLREGIVAAGFFHSAALKSDGTVLACGRNDEGQCEVSGWRDVAAIDAGAYHTVALRSDGTVLACGRNSEGQCEVSAWTGIAAVAAGDYTTYGLKADGTVVFCGYQEAAAALASWPAVERIAAGAYALVGLSGETAVATHPSARSSDMTGLVSVAVSTGYAVGLTQAGTLVCSSDAVELSDLPESVALSCSGTYIAAIGADGALHTHFFRAGSAFSTDMAGALPVALDAGNRHLLAVSADGRVRAFGDGSAGACETESWRLWDETEPMGEDGTE